MKTLISLSSTFQSKIISSLLSDNKFIQTISDILEPKYFDSDATNGYLQRLVNTSMSLEKLLHWKY